MSTEEPPVRGPRPSRSGGPSVGTTLGIVAAVVAVVIGFFILRDISNDGGTTTPGGGATTPADTTPPTDTMPAITDPPMTVAPIITTGFKVVVANASGVGGSAGQMTIALQGKGFIVESATNKAASEPVYTTTKVFYLSGNDLAAASVARVLGGVCTETMPTTPPTDTGSLGEASVLVMLGSDLAGQPLPAETSEPCVAAAATPEAPAADPDADGTEPGDGTEDPDTEG